MVDTGIKVIDHFKKLRSPQVSVDLVPKRTATRHKLLKPIFDQIIFMLSMAVTGASLKD
jgi:hypothetical protein